ncbi:transmembrane sensor/regulator PpyR [Geopseudomonas aromaticivorans]
MSGVLKSPANVFNLAKNFILAGVAILIVGVLGAYGFDKQISLCLVVGAHMLTIVGPSLIKLGYVMRLSVQDKLAVS